MKILYNGINSGIQAVSLTIAIVILLLSAPIDSAAMYSQLKGYWSCQEDGQSVSLEFQSPQKLLYNGQPYSYQLGPGVMQVMEGNNLVNYFFTLEKGIFTIFSADGSVTLCRKAQKPKLTGTRKRPGKTAPQNRPTTSSVQDWPPRYARPQGSIDEHNPGAQALLYKFAGRWDSVTTNTLTNLYLKPDGTFEEAYEAGYSGQFTDQGGYQTGHWAATGEQQAGGRWMVVGGLRKGQLHLVDQNGRETLIHYQVHIRGGEVYWGEYFFNGQLYSVKYIYR